MSYLTVSGDLQNASIKIPLLNNRPYLEKLLSFLEKVVREEDVIEQPYYVCMDCRDVLYHGLGTSKHEGHTLVLQDVEHSGVTEWVKCLKWMLEK